MLVNICPQDRPPALVRIDHGWYHPEDITSVYLVIVSTGICLTVEAEAKSHMSPSGFAARQFDSVTRLSVTAVGRVITTTNRPTD